jgi:hypothetical protein
VSVVSIEGGRGPRPVRRGANIGFEVGLVLAGCCSTAAADTTCGTEACVTWSDARFGAAIGALIPGRRTLLYAAPASSWLALAPIAGHGRRGAAVRVAF